MKYKPGQKVVCIKKPDWLFDLNDERMSSPGRLPYKEAITLFKIYKSCSYDKSLLSILLQFTQSFTVKSNKIGLFTVLA